MTSISFGRFESDESVCWERRSSFSENRRNRYVEEAEKYTRPGSVAEKRAFLEAYFTRKAQLQLSQLPKQPSISQCPPKERVEEKSKDSGVKSMIKVSAQSSTKNHHKQIPQSSLQKTSKKQSHQTSKGYIVQEIKCEKNPRGITLHPSTPERMESRRHPSLPSIKHTGPQKSVETKRSVMNTSFRSERGEKTKETKQCATSVMNCSFRSETRHRITQEKIIQSAKKPSFKAKPMPSFYYQTAPKPSNKPRVVSKRIESTESEGSILCSRTRNNCAMDSYKSQGLRASLGKRNTSMNFERHCSSNARNHIAKASQTC